MKSGLFKARSNENEVEGQWADTKVLEASIGGQKDFVLGLMGLAKNRPLYAASLQWNC